jgi:hypothetical protein
MSTCVYFVRAQYNAVFMKSSGLALSFWYEENKLKLKGTQCALKAQKPLVAFFLIQPRIYCIISTGESRDSVCTLLCVYLSAYLMFVTDEVKRNKTGMYVGL